MCANKLTCAAACFFATYHDCSQPNSSIGGSPHHIDDNLDCLSKVLRCRSFRLGRFPEFEKESKPFLLIMAARRHADKDGTRLYLLVPTEYWVLPRSDI